MALSCLAAAATEPREVIDDDPAVRAPVPAWIESILVEPPSDTKPLGAPAEILLSDMQDRLTLEGGDYYYHLVVRLLNAEGVRQNAEWSVRYTPEHEGVTWHTLKITRNGQVQDRLPAAKFKKRQRELGFETHMLDGQATLLTVLSDVQVGDILEVGYTLHDANPLLRGHLSATHYVGAGYPIKRQRLVVRTPLAVPDVFTTFYLPPGTQKLPEAIFNPAKLRLAMDTTETADERVHLWEARNLPAVVFDQNIPAQASPYFPMIRCTSFRSWREVAVWAEAVFAGSAELPPTMRTQIEAWRRDLPAPEARLRAAVRWVQDDVRYFAMEMGIHNLKPRPMAEVCSARFGDCKEKAVLLALILRELGFEAWPALVNTSLHDQLAGLGPSPFAFNHAIVAYRFGGQLKWLDATLKGQQGHAGQWAVPPYGKALIVNRDTLDLVDVTVEPTADPDTETDDTMTVDAATGAVGLKTRVVLRALQADYYREHLDGMTPAELSKRWFNFISRFYKKLEEIEPPLATDDPVNNCITIAATYRIPDFCPVENGARQVMVYAYALRALVDQPESRRRNWPYALVSARFVRQRIQLELPDAVSFEQHPQLVLSDGLDYRVEKGLSGRRLVAVHDLRINQDFVPAERMGAFCDAVDELLFSLATSLRVPVAAEMATPALKSPASVPAAAPGA